jgi:hypothetical protein
MFRAVRRIQFRDGDFLGSGMLDSDGQQRRARHRDCLPCHLPRTSSEAPYRHELERVLFCLDLAFAPEYARMRAYLQARTPALDPKRILTREAKGARWIAIDAKHRNGDPSLLERWDAFESAHPQVRAILHEFDKDRKISWRGRRFSWRR